MISNGKEEMTNLLQSFQDKISVDDWRAQEEQSRIEDDQRQLKLFNSKIPPRFRAVGELSNPVLKESTCSIVWGGFGTGKTWECYALCKELYLSREIHSFKVVTEVEMMNELKAGFSDGSFDKRVKSYQDIGLLIIDEVGKANDSDFNKSQIFEILNYRYNWMKKTVLICNAEKKEELFKVFSTPATLDRYRETVIHMSGKSRRYAAIH